MQLWGSLTLESLTLHAADSNWSLTVRSRVSGFMYKNKIKMKNV